MDIEFAVLCDAATVRDGLLHVLGAPITRIYRRILPAPLGISLAALFAFDAEDHGQLREFEIAVSSPTKLIQKGVGVVTVGPRPDKAEANELKIYSPFVASFVTTQSPEWGEHTVEVAVDGGEHSKSNKFWLLPLEDQILPGGIELAP
ncbi:MAG: hypothetical protein KGR42_05095 [Acidobacteria bacterium]|nr:hypothetical protein [Acidobacteriota bacterium]